MGTGVVARVVMGDVAGEKAGGVTEVVTGVVSQVLCQGSRRVVWQGCVTGLKNHR